MSVEGFVYHLTNEIQALRESSSQVVYLELAESLMTGLPKRFEKEIGEMFGMFCQMAENENVNLEHGIKLLKILSPFINK